MTRLGRVETAQTASVPEVSGGEDSARHDCSAGKMTNAAERNLRRERVRECSTERPEVIGTFAERVEPGPDITRIAGEWATDLDAVHARLAETPSPYGDGSASQRSVDAIRRLIDA